LRLTIDTNEETTEKALKMHASELAARMTAIGTILDSFTVKNMATTNNNANKNAVAIAYETGASAPKVVAKGKGLIAETIIARAKECGIHVHESKELVSLLMKVDLDKDIPPTLYRVVAELLAWLYHIDKEKSEHNIGTNKRESISDIPFTPTNLDEK